MAEWWKNLWPFLFLYESKTQTALTALSDIFVRKYPPEDICVPDPGHADKDVRSRISFGQRCPKQQKNIQKSYPK